MPARATALRALTALERGRIERIRSELERGREEPREFALAFELAHGVVRNQRFLDFVLQCFAHRGLPKEPSLRSVLRLGAYQLLLLSGMPQHAAVFETVALLRHNRAFANALLRRIAERIEARAADPALPEVEIALSPSRMLLLPPPGLAACSDPVAIRHSLPDFLLARWRQQHGGAAAALAAAASSARPAVFLRACGGRSAAALSVRLAAEGVLCEATTHGDLLRWTDGGSPFRSRTFADGWFVAQDPTAARAAAALGVEPGMTVVDLCAAPGTKTVLLAERAQPDGVVFAYDLDPRRRQLIHDNVRRLALEAVVRVVEGPAALPRADAVLADVPCSNTGVLARRVEARHRLRPETFAAMARIQAPLLRQALDLVRPGGRVVYSTCAIEDEENGQVVAGAGGARLLRHETTLPQSETCDGGFWALLAP